MMSYGASVLGVFPMCSMRFDSFELLCIYKQTDLWECFAYHPLKIHILTCRIPDMFEGEKWGECIPNQYLRWYQTDNYMFSCLAIYKQRKQRIFFKFILAYKLHLYFVLTSILYLPCISSSWTVQVTLFTVRTKYFTVLAEIISPGGPNMSKYWSPRTKYFGTDHSREDCSVTSRTPGWHAVHGTMQSRLRKQMVIFTWLYNSVHV